MYSNVMAPKPNELRVAFLGDSVTQGSSSIIDGPHYVGNYKSFLSKTSDGSSLNVAAYPYWTHKLMEEK